MAANVCNILPTFRRLPRDVMPLPLNKRSAELAFGTILMSR
jgi:hypothetical protein